MKETWQRANIFLGTKGLSRRAEASLEKGDNVRAAVQKIYWTLTEKGLEFFERVLENVLLREPTPNL